MILQRIFRLEFGYQLRQVSTWLYMLVVAVLAFLFLMGNFIHDAREGYFLLNGPIVLATCTVLCCVFWLLIGGAVAGHAAARDVQSRMYSLTYTAPASKAAYLGGRFLAAFSLNALLLMAIPAGLLLTIYLAGIEAELLVPFEAASYLGPYVYLVLPNAFFATAIQFSLATLSRSALASYGGGVLLFSTAYLVAQFVYEGMNMPELATLIDPIGFTPVMDMLEVWTPIDKNSRQLGLEGMLLVNRFLWLGISLGLLLFTYFRFTFTHPSPGKQERNKVQVAPPVPPLEALRWETRAALPKVQGLFGLQAQVYQVGYLSWKSFLQLARSRSGLLLLAIIAGISCLVLPNNMKHLGVPMLPNTGYLLSFITAALTQAGTSWLVIMLLTIFWAGELVWREREAGLGDMAGVTPVPEWVLFLSKFVGLSLLLVVWTALLMAAGLLAELSMGGARPELGLYLKTLFGLQLVDALLFALLALVVHVLVHQKWVGHLAMLLVYGFITQAPSLGVEHKLLIFGADTGWSYSDMRGFEPHLGPWLWFKGYWLAWALLLGVAATLLWVRGRETGTGARLRLARKRFSATTALVAGVGAGLLLVTGGFIFYNTHVLTDYTSASEAAAWQARYEQRYSKYRGLPQPRLAKTSLQVELYPRQQAAEIQGTYLLVNRHGAALDSIHIHTAAGVITDFLHLDRTAVPVISDKEFGYYTYVLQEPLQPGDSLQLSFRLQFSGQGFSNKGANASVVANGTYFRNYHWLPALGYQTTLELKEAAARQAHGLAARPKIPLLWDVSARQELFWDHKTAFEAIIGTDEDQLAVVPGTLQQAWKKEGRAYYRYATDAPIQNEWAVFSARYAVHKAQWQDVAIQLIHHPGHSAHLERTASSIAASLDYYSSQFGPYPYNHISFVEHPGPGSGLHASAINVSYLEGFSYLRPEADERNLDFAFAVAAHEVAHQWWGNQLLYAHVEGAGLLTESLSWYSAFGVVEETFGQEHLQRLLAVMRTAYQTPQSRADVPLLRAHSAYHTYRKGPFALYALSEYIGRDQVNGALRHLLRKHAAKTGDLPTSLDLYQELQRVTPDSLQYLLHDLFEANTFWDLAASQVRARPAQAGTWEVTLQVQASKMAVDSMGTETPLLLNDWIEIGIYGPAEEGAKPLYLRKHRITSGKQSITVLVPEKPASAGIDPRHLMIDWKLTDNTDAVVLGN
ncbi:M1 family aminopeptidase [Cesiribacter andamanensis]|uniref:ABC-type transport system involved in multi-copper enzyme maturation, permease component n=1 Tax=Cesiribacter andamanensis AMV16 TaxID=1279009 RepID=M7N6D2_9BACT|nr:M1 family aminopeptidase [Cesiribacter andamanensis]EMR02771.1 ABC-type transport system involved in multi-copper enzyme maturation, permease component [Cesiribacter andamanensis AMV16]